MVTMYDLVDYVSLYPDDVLIMSTTALYWSRLDYFQPPCYSWIITKCGDKSLIFLFFMTLKLYSFVYVFLNRYVEAQAIESTTGVESWSPIL